MTDPHFRGLAGARPGDFAGKRAIGFVNLVVNRGRKHKAELLAALLDDLRAHPVDHLAVTGDLSNVALEGEWRAALRWLRGQGPHRTILAVPVCAPQAREALSGEADELVYLSAPPGFHGARDILCRRPGQL